MDIKERYEVREYFDGTRLYHGVFIKCNESSYGLPPRRETDNLVVLCVNRLNAEQIRHLLEIDSVLEDRINEEE